MKRGGYERAQSSACLWDSGLLGFFQDGKNSACKSFYQYVLVPLSSNRHKLGRQNAQDGSSVKKKKVCLMSMES